MREGCQIGDRAIIGTHVTVENEVSIGSDSKLQTGAHRRLDDYRGALLYRPVSSPATTTSWAAARRYVSVAARLFDVMRSWR